MDYLLVSNSLSRSPRAGHLGALVVAATMLASPLERILYGRLEFREAAIVSAVALLGADTHALVLIDGQWLEPPA